eukprot:scaffold1657_cov182-Alexandrium_tamarense.AAC.28
MESTADEVAVSSTCIVVPIKSMKHNQLPSIPISDTIPIPMNTNSNNNILNNKGKSDVESNSSSSGYERDISRNDEQSERVEASPRRKKMEIESSFDVKQGNSASVTSDISDDSTHGNKWVTPATSSTHRPESVAETTQVLPFSIGNYIDHSLDVDDASIRSFAPPHRKPNFIESLFAILSNPELSSVITWTPHGRSFVIVDHDTFSRDYQCTYPLRLSQLNGYSFNRIKGKTEKTKSYYHEYFLRNLPHLAKRIRRCKSKVSDGKTLATEKDLARVSSERPLPREMNEHDTCVIAVNAINMQVDEEHRIGKGVNTKSPSGVVLPKSSNAFVQPTTAQSNQQASESSSLIVPGPPLPYASATGVGVMSTSASNSALLSPLTGLQGILSIQTYANFHQPLYSSSCSGNQSNVIGRQSLNGYQLPPMLPYPTIPQPMGTSCASSPIVSLPTLPAVLPPPSQQPTSIIAAITNTILASCRSQLAQRNQQNTTAQQAQITLLSNAIQSGLLNSLAPAPLPVMPSQQQTVDINSAITDVILRYVREDLARTQPAAEQNQIISMANVLESGVQTNLQVAPPPTVQTSPGTSPTLAAAQLLSNFRSELQATCQAKKNDGTPETSPERS